MTLAGFIVTLACQFQQLHRQLDAGQYLPALSFQNDEVSISVIPTEAVSHRAAPLTKIEEEPSFVFIMRNLLLNDCSFINKTGLLLTITNLSGSQFPHLTRKSLKCLPIRRFWQNNNHYTKSNRKDFAGVMVTL